MNYHAYGGVWDEHCSEGSQCATMLKNYANLVKGDECISFYITGKCSRICTFSLKSLINRSSWSKCSQRCAWSSAITDGAKSWLDMCLANPGADVFDSEDTKANADHDLDNETLRNVARNTDRSMAKKEIRSRSLMAPGLIVLVIVAGFMLSARSELKDKAQRTLIIIRGMLHRVMEKWYKRNTAGRGPLDVGSERMLHRGARRHLKSLRSTLD
ncbi:hypothetical protein FGB62_100g36 [Gracilaria domingensis]|nr:hypothetical protein FGB62_100g36 [Gracilaria domingensis]